MKKLLSFLCLLALWCVSGQAGIFKPGTRATELKSGTYFVYDACWVYGSNDWTGFFYSSNAAMKVNHGSKPSSFSTNDPCLFWTIEVVDASTGKCTMRNVDGLYADYNGNLTTAKSYVWIKTYVYGESGACGDDVYAEEAGATTSKLPSTTASENAGLWIIGNEDKSVNWTSDQGTSFKTHSAGQPMALYPAKTPECNVTSVGELSAPSELEIGSYVVFYNNATSSYVWEGAQAQLSNLTSESIKKTRSNQLLLSSTACPTGKVIYNNLPVFKVGGSAGAYTFQNVITGDYIAPLNQSSNCYATSSAETFSLKVNTNTVAIVGSNGKCFDQVSGNHVVGWIATDGDNSQYKIATVEMTTEDVDVVEIIYNAVCGDVTSPIKQEFVSPTTEYTYVVPSVYGYTTTATASAAEVVNTSKTVEYTYTKDETATALPFTTSSLSDGKFSSDTHWYKIALRETNKYAKYTNDTSIPASSENSANDFACMFMVTGDIFTGFKFQNLAAGPDKYLTVNSGNGSCSFTTTGTVFDFTVSHNSDNTKTINLFKARSENNAYLHDYTNYLGTWRADGATTDVGSNLTFAEIEDLTGTVIFEGSGYEDTDALVYNNTDYANGAAMPWYQCYNISGVTVKDSKPALINSSIAKSGIVATFPFKATTITDGEFAEDTKWYNLTIRSNKNCIYDIYDKTNRNITSTAQKLNYGSMYCFVKDADVTNGYKMYNRAAGADVSFYTNGDNNDIGKFQSEGTTLILKTNGTEGFVFQINGKSVAHINDVNDQLGVWDYSASATDGGSTLLFEEISDPNLETAKSMPQPGHFYTIQETSTSQYLTPELSTSNTSRLAMSSTATEANRIFYFTGTHLLGFGNGRFVGMSSNMLTQADLGSAGTTFYFKKQSDGVFNVIYNYDRTLYGAKSEGYVDGAGSDQTGTGYQFNVVEVTDLPLTIGTNGWSTFSAPVAVTVPSEATAYYINQEPSDNKVILAELTGTTVPANTGVIIQGTTGTTVNFSTKADDADALEGNKLVANVVATSLTGAANDGKYAFATNKTANTTGFMKLLTTITLPGHKCWLQTTTSAGSNQFLPITLTDDPTGIDSAETTTTVGINAPIYDLQGRKVSSTRKGGMYIQNGKTFIAM